MQDTTFKIINLTMAEIKKNIDIVSHSKEQSGMFKNSSINSAKEIISHSVVPSFMPICYLDEKIEKFVIVRQSDIFNHMLALYYPEDMDIKKERVEIFSDNSLGRVININNLISEKRLTDLLEEMKNKNASNEDIEKLKRFSSQFASYSIPVIVYNNAELAYLASNLS